MLKLHPWHASIEGDAKLGPHCCFQPVPLNHKLLATKLVGEDERVVLSRLALVVLGVLIEIRIVLIETIAGALEGVNPCAVTNLFGLVVIGRPRIAGDDRYVEVVGASGEEPVERVLDSLRALAGMTDGHKGLDLQACGMRDLNGPRVILARSLLVDVGENPGRPRFKTYKYLLEASLGKSLGLLLVKELGLDKPS